MTHDIKTEVLIIGAGPGGYSSGFRCADLGLDTTIINQYNHLGGVCLNVGCIPSKTLLHIVKSVAEISSLKNKGILYNDCKLNIKKIKIWQQEVINKLSNGLLDMANKRKLNLMYGIGQFLDKNNILFINNNTKEKKIIKFDKAIIASGSTNNILPIIEKKHPRIWDSTDALQLKYIPKKILVIGGGIIGLEISTIYNLLGSKIDIVENLDQIIFQADKDIINLFENCIKDKFKILLNTQIIKIKFEKEKIHVTLKNIKNNEITKKIYDTILVAIGRKPNISLLNIKELGIRQDTQNNIIVDKQMRTNISNIYAVGDVTGSPMLAHKAMHQGHIAAEVIYGKNHYFDAKVIPSVAYTHPEIAWTGLTEKEAQNKNISFETSIFPWKASGRAISSQCASGMTKLIFDKNTKRILGGSIIGVNAGELIGEISLAIEMGCYAEDIALTIHAHPTLYETIGLSAQVFSGSVTDIINKKII